jgi:tetratricopeptide (TPR) repeat protein
VLAAPQMHQGDDTEPVDNRLSYSFTRWLFRPYFDLGDAAPDGPYHLAGIDFSLRSLLEDRPYPRIQACFNPSFRGALIRDTGLTDYDVTTPLDLPEHLRSRRCGTLCDLICSFDSLPCRAQVRLAWTLSKMCFQRAAVDLIPPSCMEEIGDSDERAGLAFVRCYSRYRMNVDDPSSPYSIEEIKKVAAESPPGINCIDATYQMVVQNVKHAGNVEEAEFWQARHLDAIERSRGAIDDFTYLFVTSRYHRVGGFIPQMRQDGEALVHEMNLAEEHALALPRPDDVHRIAADEVLYPVLESRIKEALWLKDNELALDRAQKLVALSPNDARAWLQMGEAYLECERPEDALAAYRRAARLAPPGREIAWFMAGQCYEALDDAESACDAYMASLDADPLGIAAAELLEDVARRLDRLSVLSWVQPRLERLKRMKAEAPPPRAWPYKSFPSPSDAKN